MKSALANRAGGVATRAGGIAGRAGGIASRAGSAATRAGSAATRAGDRSRASVARLTRSASRGPLTSVARLTRSASRGPLTSVARLTRSASRGPLTSVARLTRSASRGPLTRAAGRALRAAGTSPGGATGPTGAAEQGIDRLLRDIEHGRFERMLSGLTAGAALVNGLEIYLEHDRASFGNPWMWAPVALTPVMVAAGTAGFFSRRAAKTALPLVSAFVVANGVQGTYLHLRGILRRPGGRSEAIYNLEMGPPLFAPMLMTMVGGMGLLAAILRRER